MQASFSHALCAFLFVLKAACFAIRQSAQLSTNTAKMNDLSAQFVQKLKALNNSQQSIESTANWCLFYSREAPTIVRVWDEEFTRTPAIDKKLAQLYLANHLIQEGRKKGREFGDEFAKVMSRALKDALKAGSEKTRKAIERLVDIWDQRKVFGSGAIKVMKDTIAKAKAVQLVKDTQPSPTALKTASSASLAPADDTKLQVLGVLADVMGEVSAAAAKTAQHTSKAVQLKPKLHLEGSVPEVTIAREVLSGCVLALQSEIRVRQRAANEARNIAAKQDESVRHLQSQVRLFTDQQDALKARMVVLETMAASNHSNHQRPKHQQPSHPPQPPQQPQQSLMGGGMLPLGGIMNGNQGMIPALPPGFGPAGLPSGNQLPLLPPEQLLTMFGMAPDMSASLLTGGMGPTGPGSNQPPQGFGQPPQIPFGQGMHGQPPQHQPPQPTSSATGSGSQLQGQPNQPNPQQPAGPSPGITSVPSQSLTTGPHPIQSQPPQQPQVGNQTLALPPDAAALAAGQLFADQHAAAMLAQALAAMPQEDRQRIALGMAHQAPPAASMNPAVSSNGNGNPPTQAPPTNESHNMNTIETAPSNNPADDLLADEDFARFILREGGDGQTTDASGSLEEVIQQPVQQDDDDYDPDNPF